MRASAMACFTASFSASRAPKAFRRCARSTMEASACSATPSERMQWWMRPGPSLPCAISKPRPSPRIMLDLGTRTLSRMISAWSSAWPKTARARKIFTPGASFGTRIMDCCSCNGPVKLVLPSSTKILHSGRMAPEIHHLCPLTTYSSPSGSILVEMFVASEDATPGSVIAKAERISPFSKGSSHCFFCSGEPNLSRTSMFPVSGAEQFIARFAAPFMPRISAMGEYSSTVSLETSGRKRFMIPRDLASARSWFRIGGSGHFVGWSTVFMSSRFCWLQVGRAGLTTLCTKSRTFSRTSKKRGVKRSLYGRSASGRSLSRACILVRRRGGRICEVA
mmetsp:Transcript_11058/g.35035  ORF Transcript_11058/g.35035 Transcript_11058/m.35035 type:complete len:335 (-) Transcript_11058:24-1028(-)